MNTQTFSNWIQIITGLAVVIGLFLVFIELRQAKQLASADLVSQGFAEGLSTQRDLMGEEFATVLANACMHPDDLTDDQIVALDFYFQVQLNNVIRMEFLVQVADIPAPDIVLMENLRPIMVTKHGRYWITQKELPPRVHKMVNSLANEPGDCGDYYRDLKELGASER
jgi:hypothetical protein